MMWSDKKYDYFRTSDGHLYRALRNLERDAAEAANARSMYWINIQDKALQYFAIAFSSADVVLLVLLICFGCAR